MGRPSNTCNGIQFARISTFKEATVYSVTNIEEASVIGTVQKTDAGWTAYNTQGEEIASFVKRQTAGEIIRSTKGVPIKAAPVKEPSVAVKAPVVAETTRVVPQDGKTLPTPVQTHPAQVTWVGKGSKKMFPEEIRSTIRKGHTFSCDEEYINWNSELTYILQDDSCRDFEVPARFFQ